MSNRPIINELTNELANMIAAGEVIERPASVVKELVENSIDAVSSVIRVDLMNSGIDKITVIDNGIGMTKDDILKAIKPHATSKIKNKDDLFNITTLGFRGEALPSILSISKMKITSSIDGYSGYFRSFEGVKQIEEGIVSFPKGTKIEVNDLFFNTPARYKHLSNETTELSHIVQLVNKFSIAYPNIAFILTNNQKVVYSTDGNIDYDLIINNIFGTLTAKSMLKFEGSSSLYKISGYTSTNSVFRSNKNGIIIMINNRVIKNQNLVYAILDAYKTYLPIGKFPITILNIYADFSLIDVNVHPTKQDVRFTDEKELRYLVTSTIEKTISSINHTFEVSSSHIEKSIDDSTLITNTKEFSYSWDDFKDAKDMTTTSTNTSYEDNAVDTKYKDDDEFKYDFESYERANVSLVQNKVEEQKFNFEEKTSDFFKTMRYIGQFNETYLLLEKDDSLYLIDQHAAAERVRYENISKGFGTKTTSVFELLVPIKVEISMSELILLNDKKSDLERMGISYDEFGQTTILVRKIPTWIPESNAISVLNDVLELIKNDKAANKSVVFDELAKLISCKGAIKANMKILDVEVKTLLSDMDNCSNPFTCPHGRPTVIHLSKYEIEKLFKRVM